MPFVSLISVTVAPGMTPPCWSFTVPVTVLVVICPHAGSTNRLETNRLAQTSLATRDVLMPEPSLVFLVSTLLTAKVPTVYTNTPDRRALRP